MCAYIYHYHDHGMQTGKLHVTVEGCKMAFMEEMVFWDIDEMMMEKCCHQVRLTLVRIQNIKIQKKIKYFLFAF